MRFEDASRRVISDLVGSTSGASGPVARGLSLALAVWPSLATADPDGGWDLFGLDVVAAAEVLHLGLADEPDLDDLIDTARTRTTVTRLVETLARSLESAVSSPTADLAGQLELNAAAGQLYRALDALA